MPGTRYVIVLPPDLEAAAVARTFVSAHAHQLSPACLDDALLCVSELVSNAVLHGRPDITLQIRIDPPGIGMSVAVTDTGADLPVTGDGRPDATNPHGRGLMIVAAVARTWGVDTRGGGHHPAYAEAGHALSAAVTADDIGAPCGSEAVGTGKTIWFKLSS